MGSGSGSGYGSVAAAPVQNKFKLTTDTKFN